MTWKRGLVALSAATIVTLLGFTLATGPGPASDHAQLARTPDQSSSPSAPGTEPPPLRGPSDAVTFTARPTPKRSAATTDLAAVAALKSALRKSMRARGAPLAPLTPESPLSPPEPAASLDFVLSTFNVLGSSHTAPGGTHGGMAPGQTRIRWAASLLARHGVDVVGFQELQLDQLRTFLGVTDGRYDAYPGFSQGGRGSNNSVAWRTDMWELVDASTVPIPYFNGSRWPMPVVLLRNRDTGLSAYFTNFHNPASTRLHPNQERWRSLAAALEVRLVNRLTSESDYPVFLTGDLNERESAFCKLTGGAAMIAANGGSNEGSCQPPRPTEILWIFGSAGVTFSNYQADRSALVNRTTDHPMIVSHVRIEGEPARG